MMFAGCFHAADHDLHWARRLELARCHLPAHKPVCLGDIEIAVVKANAGAAAFAKRLFHIQMTIALGVPKRDHATAIPATRVNCEEAIPVGCDGDLPGGTDIVGCDKGAKSFGERDAAIVAITCGCS